MRILAFETSAKAGSVALTDNGILLGESYQNTGLTHSQTVMTMAEDLLKSCGILPAQVDAVAVAAGPGSFTGVRIGVAAAKGFAWGGQLPCYGVSTLEAMALGLGVYDGYVCPVMDVFGRGWKAHPHRRRPGHFPGRFGRRIENFVKTHIFGWRWQQFVL